MSNSFPSFRLHCHITPKTSWKGSGKDKRKVFGRGVSLSFSFFLFLMVILGHFGCIGKFQKIRFDYKDDGMNFGCIVPVTVLVPVLHKVSFGTPTRLKQIFTHS